MHWTPRNRLPKTSLQCIIIAGSNTGGYLSLATAAQVVESPPLAVYGMLDSTLTLTPIPDLLHSRRTSPASL